SSALHGAPSVERFSAEDPPPRRPDPALSMTPPTRERGVVTVCASWGSSVVRGLEFCKCRVLDGGEVALQEHRRHRRRVEVRHGRAETSALLGVVVDPPHSPRNALRFGVAVVALELVVALVSERVVGADALVIEGVVDMENGADAVEEERPKADDEMLLEEA